MAAHSSVLAWRIPGTGEPGGLPSMGLHSRTLLKRLSSSSSRELYEYPKDVMFCLKYAGHISEGRKEKKKMYVYVCVCVCVCIESIRGK